MIQTPHDSIPTPLIHEILWQEPLNVFALWADQKHALFLDSAQQQTGYGQYSFIAVEPFLTLSCKNNTLQLGDKELVGNPFIFLKQQLAQFPLTTIEGLPPFQGGVGGYWAYELLHHLETIPYPTESLTIPDMDLGFYDVVIGFDLQQQRAWVFSSGYPEQDPALRQQQAENRLAEILTKLKTLCPLIASKEIFCTKEAITSNFDAHTYPAAVQQVIDYVLGGDIFQANIAQCFSTPIPENFYPFSLYRNLREINPALFSAYFNAAETVIASASPERFIKLAAQQITTCPIKGTRPRGTTPEADEFYKNELLHSEKDWAENTMIVDLLRNDISKVCLDHSVQVPTLCGLESFATVHHLVSVITAKLKPEHDAVDLLCATFPGGSITGAPKIRAMEIINEIERQARGPYCGCMGYIGFNGDMDTSIVIRTFVIHDNTIHFHAGGGITADSNPAQEYAETLTKAKALLDTLSR